MKSKLLALLFLAGTSVFAGPRFFVGFGFGGYPAPVPVYTPPPVITYYAPPPYPGPGYTFVSGYWYPAGPRWVYRRGYWARPPYPRAYWVSPRYTRGRYYAGYWRR